MPECRGCAAKIEWMTNEKSGKVGPVQHVKAIYKIVGKDRVVRVMPGEPLPEVAIFVSHFETCPQVDMFSQKKKHG